MWRSENDGHIDNKCGDIIGAMERRVEWDKGKKTHNKGETWRTLIFTII